LEIDHYWLKKQQEEKIKGDKEYERCQDKMRAVKIMM
jgi:hypothetical protein